MKKFINGVQKIAQNLARETICNKDILSTFAQKVNRLRYHHLLRSAAVCILNNTSYLHKPQEENSSESVPTLLLSNTLTKFLLKPLVHTQYPATNGAAEPQTGLTAQQVPSASSTSN
jgi:hypothetical protein